MKEERKIYSRDFKDKALELSDLRGNSQQVARELGIDVKLIYRWRRELKDKRDLAFSGNGNQQLTDEQKEVAKLKKELADVKMERDILKKAISIFSVSDRKSTDS